MPPVTSRVPGNGSTTLTYTIPGSGLDVETVRVSVDATAAGGPVTATVTITDQSGVVIATKPQNATIPAGAIGSATWALRLDDESAGGATTNAVLYDTNPQNATFLDSTTSDGVRIFDQGPTSAGIELFSDDGSGAGGGIDIATGDGEILLSSLLITLKTDFSGMLEVRNQANHPIFRVDNQGSVDVILSSGMQLNVVGPASTPIMRVTDGGGGAPTYQIKTGAAWVANL